MNIKYASFFMVNAFFKGVTVSKKLLLKYFLYIKTVSNSFDRFFGHWGAVQDGVKTTLS